MKPPPFFNPLPDDEYESPVMRNGHSLLSGLSIFRESGQEMLALPCHVDVTSRAHGTSSMPGGGEGGVTLAIPSRHSHAASPLVFVRPAHAFKARTVMCSALGSKKQYCPGSAASTSRAKVASSCINTSSALLPEIFPKSQTKVAPGAGSR